MITNEFQNLSVSLFYLKQHIHKNNDVFTDKFCTCYCITQNKILLENGAQCGKLSLSEIFSLLLHFIKITNMNVTPTETRSAVEIF